MPCRNKPSSAKRNSIKQSAPISFYTGLFKPRAILYYLLLLLFSSFHAFAQPKCKIEYFSTENGLSHNSVTSLLKDHNGFLWFATWGGLNRFDGYQFLSYKSVPGDNSPLTNDRIDDIVADGTANLWLMGAGKQVYKFNRENGAFLNISALVSKERGYQVFFEKICKLRDGSIWLFSAEKGWFSPQKDGPQHKEVFKRYGQGAGTDVQVPFDQFNFMEQDKQLNVWIGSVKGLIRMRKDSKGLFKPLAVDPAIARKNFSTFTEGAAAVYFGTNEGELVIYHKYTNSFSIRKSSGSPLNALKLSLKKNVIYAATGNGALLTMDLNGNRITVSVVDKNPIHTIYEDRSGMLWIQPDKRGVIRFDPYSATSKHYTQVADRQVDPKVNYFKVFEDKRGLVWVNMKGGGFGYYDAGRDQVAYFYNKPNSIDRQFSNVVYKVFYDPQDVMWLSTDDRGIHKVIFQDHQFSQQLVDRHTIDKANNEIRGILYDRNKRLWFGVKSGKLLLYRDGHQLSDQVFVNEPPGGLGPVYTMLEDKAGNIWFGTKGNGLFKASPTDPARTRYRLSHFVNDPKDGHSLSSNQVYALLQDKKGQVWVATFGRGLNLVRERGNQLDFLQMNRMARSYPQGSFQQIRHLASDEKGHVWAGTTDGLLILDIYSPEFRTKTYRKQLGKKNSLGNNDIQFIYRDAKNRMWLGTSGAGLELAGGKDAMGSLIFKNFPTNDGLGNSYLLGCVEDQTGRLWISSHGGLSRFDPGTHTFRNFDTYDGLPKVNFSEGAALGTANGDLVFGTVKGFIRFRPADIRDEKVKTNLVFTGLEVNNKTRSTRNGMLQKDINYLSMLCLKHYENSISITYVTLSQRYANKQWYAYRLKGYEKEWQLNNGEQRSTYTDLPPGKYTFEVKSMNKDLYAPMPYRRLEIVISPALWQTWWACLGYLILCIILVESITLVVLPIRLFDNEHFPFFINDFINRQKADATVPAQEGRGVQLSPSAVKMVSRDDDFLREVVRIVEDGMVSTAFNIDQVAETIGMARTTFYRKFKQLTDLTPVEFVRDMRLQRAKQLLDGGETNISIVAYTSGFNDAKYFSTCFKEKYQRSPSAYLKQKT